MQIILCKNPSNCWFGDYPTLKCIDELYGEDTAELWLGIQLDNLMEYCGCKVKLNEVQIDELSALIYLNYSFLRFTELMLFFWYFKTAKFGKFYGTMDPIVIMEALQIFVCEQRAQAISGEEIRIQQEYEDSRNAFTISETEYLNKKGIPGFEKKNEKVIVNLQTSEANKAAVLDSALALVNNRYGYSEDILKLFYEAWEKAHKVSPAEYINNNM